MRQRRLELDVITYSSSMKCFEIVKCWQGALEVVSQIHQHRVTLDVRLLSMAISACELVDPWQRASHSFFDTYPTDFADVISRLTGIQVL